MCYSSAGRFCVGLLITLLMIIGLAFFIVGVYPIRAHVPYNFREFVSTYSTVKTLLIVSGLLALCVCALAIIGICCVLWYTESKCLLYWLAVFVVVAIIVDIILIVEVVKVKDRVNDFLTTKLPLYGIDPSATMELDFYQRRFRCCGVYGMDDYTVLGKQIPDSCCPLIEDHFVFSTPKSPKYFPFSEFAAPKPDNDLMASSNSIRSIPGPLEKQPTNPGDYRVNVATRVDFELPEKNMTGLGAGGIGNPGGLEGHLRCPGCLTELLSEYNPYFLALYLLVAAKILLEIAVGVSPCWVMIQEKWAQLNVQPSVEDGGSLDAAVCHARERCTY